MSGAEVTVRLPALPESVPAARTRARRFVRLPPNREDALALLVTEIMGSVVLGGPPTSQRVIEMTLTQEAEAVLVTVSRTDVPTPPLAEEDRDADLAIRLLDRLADGWGDADGVRWVRLRTHVQDHHTAGCA